MWWWAKAISFLIKASCGYSISLAFCRRAISRRVADTHTNIHAYPKYPSTPTNADPTLADGGGVIPTIVNVHLVVLVIAEYALALIVRIRTWWWLKVAVTGRVRKGGLCFYN
ncbi:hypothetical protein HOY80DRAFT_306653 [Tuber brumale]|nr:hypothetical protein HOY80DRAFT_306653 [Tuber brumale]